MACVVATRKSSSAISSPSNSSESIAQISFEVTSCVVIGCNDRQVQTVVTAEVQAKRCNAFDDKTREPDTAVYIGSYLIARIFPALNCQQF